MKVNELMIGDWYSLINPDGHKCVPQKATVDCLMLLCTDNRYNCEPIPLTEEILKANGIPTNGDTFLFDNDKDYVLELCFISGRLYWTINLDEYRLMDFKYVHELQHALRICGLNDLADNFKIK